MGRHGWLTGRIGLDCCFNKVWLGRAAPHIAAPPPISLARSLPARGFARAVQVLFGAMLPAGTACMSTLGGVRKSLLHGVRRYAPIE